MHVDSDRPRKILNGVRKLDNFMTVHARDNGVHTAQQRLLPLAVLFPASVLEVVGVDDSNNVSELIRPSSPVMEPRQVLGFLEHRHVSLLLRHALGDVAHGHDAALVYCISPRIEVNIEVGLEIDTPGEPIPDVLLLLLGSVENSIRMHQLLITSRHPWHEEGNSAISAAVGEVRRSQQRIHRRARHPRKARRRDDGEVPSGIP